MKRHKQLWGKVASPENLLEAAQDALRIKRGPVAVSSYFGESRGGGHTREMEVGR